MRNGGNKEFGCQWSYCRDASAVVYIRRGLCLKHWNEHCEYEHAWESPIGQKIVAEGDGKLIGYRKERNESDNTATLGAEKSRTVCSGCDKVLSVGGVRSHSANFDTKFLHLKKGDT